MKKIAALAALFLILGSVPGWCLCSTVDDWLTAKADSSNYAVKAGGMILRGLDRIVESPVELVCHTYKGATEELRYGVGILKGLGYGTLWMGDSIIRGGWDVLTFAIPDYHGEPGEHHQECWGKYAGGGTKKA